LHLPENQSTSYFSAMITIKNFVFNSFMVNSYLLYDETGDAVLIDAACYEDPEKRELKAFLDGHKLTLKRLICTHCHVDHVLGNDYIASTFHVFPEFHEAGLPFFATMKEIGLSLGFIVASIPPPKRFIADNEIINVGKSGLKVFYTPGHAHGSICLYNEEQKFVVTGDVLFKDTIGRTDLPSGNLDLLQKSIRERLFTLPGDVTVYPGHGPETSIGYEKMNNPFVR
jgi:hydroxyacylglutathione hydrolase